MKRRSFLGRSLAVGIPVSLGGCVSNSDTGNDARDDDQRSIGAFQGVLVDEAPSGASVVSLSDDRIADVELLRHLLERAADSSAEKDGWVSDGDEYDAVYVPGSFDAAEKRAAADVIDELSAYDGEDDRAPSGASISHQGQTVAVTYTVVHG